MVPILLDVDLLVAEAALIWFQGAIFAFEVRVYASGIFFGNGHLLVELYKHCAFFKI